MTTDINPAEFLVAEVAEQAASALAPGPTANGVLRRLGVVPVSTTDVVLAFTARSRLEATTILNRYTAEYVAWKRSQQERALADALKSVRATLKSLQSASPSSSQTPQPVGESAREARRIELQAHIDRLQLARDLIPEQVARIGTVDATLQRAGLRPGLAIAGGSVAGLALGLLLALVLVRFDPRVRSRSDLAFPDARVVDVESRHSAASMQRLRSELEVMGLGRDLSVVIVTAASRAESRTPIALGLAEAYASTGTQTVIVSADIGRNANGINAAPLLEAGVSTFLDGADDQLAAAEVAANLVWVPKGKSHAGADLRISSAQVGRLLAEARELGQVVVVDAPPVSDSAGLLFAAAGDINVIVVQRSRTSWSALGIALERLEAATRAPLQICFDRSRASAGRSEASETVALKEAHLPVRP